jgi:hypothetical protein
MHEQAHGEWAGHRDFDAPRSVAPQELQRLDLHSMQPLHRSDNARHQGLAAGAAHDPAGTIGIHARKRIGQVIRIALAADFAVADDIQARFFLHADGQARGIVHGFIEKRLLHAPQVHGAHARRRLFRKLFAVDQPIRLRQASDDGGGQ